MANENLAIDGNMRNTLGAVTNDGNEEIRRVRVNPITGALIVEANITSTNTSIGSTIPGATQGSVFFAGPGGTLDQDNPNFFWDDTNNFLGIATSTPGANLDVQGTAIITGDLGVATDLVGRSGSGEISGVTIGSGLSLVGNVLSSSGGAGYDTVQNQGVSVTQRSILNLTNLLTASDVGGKTQLTVNEANLDLANIGGTLNLATQVTGILDVSHLDQTTFDLGTMGGQIDLTTQVTGLLPSTNIDITTLEADLDLGNIAGQIDLTTQVTGLLGVANIDVIALADDATFLTELETNLSGNIAVAVDGTTITGDGTTGNPLVASGGGSLPGSFGYLPLGKRITAGATDGDVVQNNVFVNAATSRIYTIFGANNNTPSLRIFKNDYGTYYQEREVTIALSDLSLTTGTAITEVSWTCDESYVYAIVNYEKSTATTFQRIDVVRYSLDGTSPTATNIFAQSPTVANARNYSSWEQGLSNTEYRALTIVGSSLWTTWTVRTGASTYTRQLREYTISGVTYTLANTYTVTSTNNTTNAFNLRYDSTNVCFYFGGVDNSTEPLIDTYTISGANIAFTTSTTYPEFGYGNNKPNGVLNDGFNISSVIDQATYNQIFVVQAETGSSGSLGASPTAFSYRLFAYNMPKF